MVECLVWDQDAAGSIPVTSIIFLSYFMKLNYYSFKKSENIAEKIAIESIASGYIVTNTFKIYIKRFILDFLSSVFFILGDVFMIFVTGDCHGEFDKFSTKSFPKQKNMTKNDIVIICGDFGAIWDWKGENSIEKYNLKWLDNKNFTTVFVDGNHENFDRLNNDYPIVDFCGGKAHKIRNSIFHLMRGEVFNFEGKKFFAFGGASSHDISAGILYRENFGSDEEFNKTIKLWYNQGKLFRVNHRNWWEEEMPSQEEMDNGLKNLEKVNYKVDYVISHCCPIIRFISDKSYKPDILIKYFENINSKLDFKYWYFGHYHDNKKFFDKYFVLYENIIRII